MFAFIGAARTGKSTTAKAVAEAMGLHYHDASISKFAKEIGVNAVGDLSVVERLRVQQHLLKRYVEELFKAPRPAITDRSPLDMISYMLGDVTMHNTTPEAGAAIHAYVKSCLMQTDRLIDTVIVTRPLAFYETDPSKPPANLAYQWQTQMVIEGAADQLRQTNKVTLMTDALEERIAYSVQFISQRLNELREESQARLIC